MVHGRCGQPAFFVLTMPSPHTPVDRTQVRLLDGFTVPSSATLARCGSCGAVLNNVGSDVYPEGGWPPEEV